MTLPVATALPSVLEQAATGVPRRIGFGRDVPEPLAQRVTAGTLSWSASADGSVSATASVTSPGASAVRLGLLVRRLPPGAELRFFRPGFEARAFGPFLEADVRAATGHGNESGGLFWSPVIDGDTAALEIFLPAGANPDQVSLTIPRISHLAASPAGAHDARPLSTSQSCQIDVACHAGTWGTTALAVALYTYTEGDGASYLCSGTLLNNAAFDGVPYFLSANHCVSTSSAAATMNSYWFYQRSFCGGSSTLPVRQLTRGATLLATNSATDWSFFRLNEPAPAGAVFAGWNAGPVAAGQSITGIHHPRGDYKKISFGWLDGVSCWGCQPTGSGSFLKVTYSQGLTEPGSSGSGLFTGSQQVVGVLRGGTAAICGTVQHDWYGRFDLIYPSIRAWLNPAVTRVIGLTGDLAFGAVHIGGLAARMLVITNTGNAPLTVSSISHPSGFSVSWPGGTIPAGGAQAVTVTSAPLQAGPYGGNVTIHANQTAGTNTISASATGAILVTPQSHQAGAMDVDGDGRIDPTVWRQATGVWYARRSSDLGTVAIPWGTGGDVPVPGDYDNDGKSDPAVWRPASGIWYVVRSSDGTEMSRPWGAGYAPYHDVPVPGDYDGDGATDFAVWRPSTGMWYVIRSSDATLLVQHWGSGDGPYFDVPAVGDYDGDSKADFAVWRRSTGAWYVLESSTGSMISRHWGAGRAPYYDLPAPGDYDGDGRTDFSVWRPSTGHWYTIGSADDEVQITHWGAGYAPYYDYAVPGDYDGDGRTDVAIWRSATGVWYVVASSDGSVRTHHWGAGSAPYFDTPIPSGRAR